MSADNSSDRALDNSQMDRTRQGAEKTKGQAKIEQRRSKSTLGRRTHQHNGMARLNHTGHAFSADSWTSTGPFCPIHHPAEAGSPSSAAARVCRLCLCLCPDQSRPVHHRARHEAEGPQDQSSRANALLRLRHVPTRDPLPAQDWQQRSRPTQRPHARPQQISTRSPAAAPRCP